MSTRPSNWPRWPNNKKQSCPVSSISHTLREARNRLALTSPSPSLDASVLLCHVLDCTASHLLAWPEQMLSSEQTSRFEQMLAQRLEGRPVAYITGTREFWSLTLKVNPDVLIPRPETETLIEYVLATFADREQLDIADLGTGSGAIACALAIEHPQWQLTATDASAAALQIARENVSACKLSNVRLLEGHWFEPLAGMVFDLVISNPPYVADRDPHLEQDGLRFEPAEALTAGPDGMDAIDHLAKDACLFLKDRGWLIVEHGFDQQQAVYNRFEDSGFDNIIQVDDLAGQPRMTAGQYRRKT